MWLRCIERPFALVGIAPHAYAPQGARTIAIYGHAPMELVSMPTAAANGAGEHILSMRRVRSTALACRGLPILHILADHSPTYVCATSAHCGVGRERRTGPLTAVFT